MPLPHDLLDVIRTGDFVLFLGAGYSKDSNLPLWDEALLKIATRLTSSDPTRAALIGQEASKRRYLEAAETFYLSDLTKAERAAILKEVFDPDFTHTRRQKQLAALACQGIITTNFDRVLVTAAGEQRTAVFTECDDDLHAARVHGGKFVLRLHGRIESPETIVFAKRHYDQLPRRTAYIEFFREIFMSRNVIFFGFSFADPFIASTIKVMSEAANSVFRRKAFALLDAMPDPATQTMLDLAAIRPIVYDPANRHQEAWEALLAQPPGVVAVSVEDEKAEALRREMATVYARAKSRSFSSERVQVLAGLLRPVIERQGVGVSVRLDDFIRDSRRELAIPASVPDRDIRFAMLALEADGILEVGPDTVKVLAAPDAPSMELPLEKLLDGVTARALARYQHKIPLAARDSIKDAIACALAIDGLHVAHGVIRHRPLDNHKIKETIERAVRLARFPPGVDGSAISQSLLHLFTHPDTEEERLLGVLSSVAFSTSLLIEDPVLALSHDPIDAAGVFLDANVVLPWICAGHPLTDLYGGIIDTFGGNRIFLLAEYANELVSHRRLAVQAHRDGGFDEPTRLQRFVSLFEAHGINAFLAGYAGVQAAGFDGRFEDYLGQYAPFESDPEAIRFLESKGVTRSELTPEEINRARGGTIHLALRDSMRARRNDIVIEHDARQIQKLLSLHARGTRPYFLTADKVLISSMAQSDARVLLRRVLLPYQASYLAQLGGAKMRPGLARAMWMSPPEVGERIRDYYIDRVLREYETGLLMSIPEIVNDTMKEIDRAERLVGNLQDLESGDDERVRIFRTLDRFEDGFYRKMLDAKRSAGLV